MATLPEASITLVEQGGTPATGVGLIVVMAPVAQSPDFVPRIFGNAADILTQYSYAPGVDYAAIHIQKTRKPIMFIGMPIATPGAITYTDTSAVTGSSLISVAVGANGAMDEVQGVLTVTQGGTIGTNAIVFTLSLDNGTSTQNVRLGTGNSYAIPNFGLTLSFAAGTLNVGDVMRFNTTGPMWGSTAITSARTALAAQQTLAQSWLVAGDVPNSTFANYVVTEANNYASANQRYVYARMGVSDRSPLPTMSKNVHQMSTAQALSFSSVSHTITRTTGSWLTDGFAVGDVVTVAGSASNNGSLGAITVLTATIMTFAAGVVTETSPTTVVVTGSPGLTFAAAGFTITRTAGSFLSEGFAIGQSVTISGTSSNNTTLPITALSATVMTFASGIVNEGPDASGAVTIQQSLTMSAWMAAQTAAFASVSAQPRVDISAGRARVQSPIHGFSLRRPAAWAASCREYTHDVQIPSYRKADGPLDGYSILDSNGNVAEFDERVTSGGLAGLFTCLRTYGNGPIGTFVALSLTRDTDGNPLSRTHNMAVANVGCTTVQSETENAIGQVLVLNADGTGTDASLSLIEQRVNSSLQRNLLQLGKEGVPRASSAQWTASRTDILSSPGAHLHGTLALNMNGVLENIDTTVVVH